MTHINPLVTVTPRMPSARGPLARMAMSGPLHGLVLAGVLAALQLAGPSVPATKVPMAATPPLRVLLPGAIFLARQEPGSGGGGGGNRQPGPIRRAQGIGSDPITLRVAPPIALSFSESALEPPSKLPGLLLAARPLASGEFDQIGLPSGGVPFGISTGPGSGGGVGEGVGTGIGSGRGPGVGPGSGGGMGGGAYRPGGAVTAPRLISQVRPNYTAEALFKRIVGSVVLEVVVGRDGWPSQLRVERSLDPGLDEEAVKAVSQWRFEPGRLAGSPVDVVVTVFVDFSIR